MKLGLGEPVGYDCLRTRHRDMFFDRLNHESSPALRLRKDLWWEIMLSVRFSFRLLLLRDLEEYLKAS